MDSGRIGDKLHFKVILSKQMAKITILHGPNLNLLGQREANIYGDVSLKEINDTLHTLAQGHALECFQSNAEHELVEKIHLASKDKVDFLIINPAALTHTSISLRDALLATKIPFIEVHLSNPLAREVFRHHSYFSDIAVGVVSGLGAQGYYAALNAALSILKH
uniref:3-dehydroquinate dehydratase n=2 Tax=Candidatus Berkiella cookevillensis TaxID=437022 RepID=A0A0Q9YD50_9GAMM